MKSIFKLTFTISLLGILLLLFLTNTLEPKITNIQDLSTKNLNQKVKIQGQVIKIINKENFQIITLKDSTAQINILANSKLSKEFISKNITAIGTISKYNQELQINVNKIISLP